MLEFSQVMVVDHRITVHPVFEVLEAGTHQWGSANLSVDALCVDSEAGPVTVLAIADKRAGIVLHETALERPAPGVHTLGDYTLDQKQRLFYYKGVSQYRVPALPESKDYPQALTMWRIKNLIVFTDYDASLASVILLEFNGPRSG